MLQGLLLFQDINESFYLYPNHFFWGCADCAMPQITNCAMPQITDHTVDNLVALLIIQCVNT